MTLPEEKVSVNDALRWAVTELSEKGLEPSHLDARLLLANVLGCTKENLFINGSDSVHPKTLQVFRGVIARRLQGEPVAYLVGRKDFHSETFVVSPSVLIPRPESEIIVTEGLRFLRQFTSTDGRPPRVLDIGTGSGCLAICLRKHFPGATFVALDICPAALQVARANAHRILEEAAEDIKFVEADIRTWLHDRSGEFDLIVANPPYIGPFEAVDHHVVKFEPHHALFASELGDAFYRYFARCGHSLSSKGALMVELPGRLHPIDTFFGPHNGWSQVEWHKDLAGLPRLLKAFRNLS